MGWRGTLILSLLVAIAAGALLLIPKAPPEVSDSTLLGEPRFLGDVTPSDKLLTFEPADVSQMTFGFGDEVVTVARQGDSWRGAANPGPLNDFLQSLQEAPVISTLDGNRELGDFGLDAPTRRLLLEMQNRQQLVLLIGDRNPAATSVYVRVGEDGPVSIAGALLVREFDTAFAAVTGRKSPL